MKKLMKKTDYAYIWMKVKKDQLLSAKDKGMGTVEIILIIIVLISLVLIFKDQLTALVETLFKKINKQANQV